MRRSSIFKSRLTLLAGLAVGAMYTAAAWAQDAAGGAAPAGEGVEKIPSSLIGVILSNKDFVFFIIVGLSIIGLTFIIQGFIRNRASVFMPEGSTNMIREMIAQKRFKELIDFTETDPSFVSRSLNPALKRAPSFSSMKEAMETAIGEQTAEAFRKIEYLNIIGNLGPLLGLLGTVLGMIAAFTAMNQAEGGASPAQLAGGISKALAHTFMGLLLAVPCLACFGILRTIVDRLTVRGAMVAEELLLMVKPAEAKPAAPGARPPTGAPAPVGARKIPAPPLPPAPSPA